MYETCIFDLYGTLIDIHTEEEKEEIWECLSLFLGYQGAVYTSKELHDLYCKIVKELQMPGKSLRQDSHEAFPEIQIEKVFARCYQEKGIVPGSDLVIHTAQFFRAMSTEYIRLYEGTKEMLQSLRKEGKKLYLLSNAQKIFAEPEMKALGIYDCFDGILISSEAGIKKPEAGFFQMLLDRYSISKDTAVMIGNDGICDIAGAKKAGFDTVYIHSNLSPEEDDPKADMTLKMVDMKALENYLLDRKV